MSIGHCGYARLILADESALLYSYCAYSLNSFEWSPEQKKLGLDAMKKMEDGEICIQRSALVEPELREKRRKLPSGKRMTYIKRIMRPINICELLGFGQVTIRNATGEWKTIAGEIGWAGVRIAEKILAEYQELGEIPPAIYFIR